MKLRLIIFILLLPSIVNANPFTNSRSWFENEAKVARTLSHTTVENLSPKSQKVHESALDIFVNPDSEQVKINFLNNFPRRFIDFLDIFHPSNFDQLYSNSDIYILLLKYLSNEYPDKAGEIILNLAGAACLDADAPNAFRFALTSFQEVHPMKYEKYFDVLSQKEQENVHRFLAASIHDWGEGVCDFETVENLRKQP